MVRDERMYKTSSGLLVDNKIFHALNESLKRVFTRITRQNILFGDNLLLFPNIDGTPTIYQVEKKGPVASQYRKETNDSLVSIHKSHRLGKLLIFRT